MYEIDFNQFREIFFSEARENLGGVHEPLAQLEKNPRDIPVLFEVFRVAHTLKGMSATMGFEKITKLTTEMARLLDKLHKGKLIANEETIKTISRCFAAVETLVQEVFDGDDKGVAVDSLVEELRTILETKQADQEIILIKEIFFSEAREHLESVGKSLSQLAKNPRDPDVLFEVFRIAHTIKGMSATMGYEKLTTLSTEMAEVLNELREGRRTATAEMVSFIATCFDAVKLLLEEVYLEKDQCVDVESFVKRLRGIFDEKK
jgi:chemotaxis protein histidine kinase CheA